MFNKKLLVLLTIILLGTFLRFYKLDSIPNSLSGDEVAFGYNAYSVLKTGRDEFGYKFPLYFRSFDDYKNPVFGYLLIPFIAILGLNEVAIRLPSAITGVLILPLIYLLTRKLTNNSKIALLTTFFAAVSPWLIQYSRVAIEIELALFLSLLAVYLFLKGKEKPFYYLLSSIFFALSFYTYHSSKFWVIAIGIVLLILYRTINRYVLISGIIFAVLSLPYLYLLTSTKVALRPYAISVFANQEEIITDANLILSDQKNNIILGKFFHNRRFTFFNQVVNGYLRILNPEILFTTSSYNQIPTTRLFYLWQLPLILLGSVCLFRKRSLFVLIFSWLIIGFVPGGITVYPVFDRRIFLNSFPLIFLSAYGIYYLTGLLSKKGGLTKLLLFITYLLLFIFSFVFYLHNYFIHGKTAVVYLWGNGIKNLVQKTNSLQKNYRKVVVSTETNQPLIFFLFYEKYSPEKYLKEGGTVTGGFLEDRNKFDKYLFKRIKFGELDNNTLYVTGSKEMFPCLKTLTTVYLTDGQPLARISNYNAGECKKWMELTQQKIN